jgi:hypothetical protein
VKQLGFRSANWLSADQCSAVSRVLLAVLFGCVLRRSELVALEMDQVQIKTHTFLSDCASALQGCPFFIMKLAFVRASLGQHR